MNKAFDSYQIAKNDEIDNAAYALAVALLRSAPDWDNEAVMPWDIEIISKISEAAYMILCNEGYQPCHPYRIDGIPCSQSESCKSIQCYLKKEETE